MKISVIKNFYPLFIIFILCGTFCTKTPPPAQYNGIITFSTGEVLVNSMKALPGTEVKNGDTVTTGAKSSAVIQITETGIIAVKENTLLKFDLFSITDGKISMEIAVDKGYIFNKLMKNSGSYTVKTSSVLAAVRGTSFSVSADDKGKSDVKLLSGSVEVKHKTSGKAVTLAEKETVSASADNIASAQKLPDTDAAKMQQLDSIKILPAEKIKEVKDNQKTDESVVPGSVLPVLDETEEVDTTSPKMTLAELEKKYGQLSRVILTSGKEYIGSFRQAGGKMEIITVNGTLKISAASVSNVQPYKK